MNKAELVEVVAQNAGITKTQANSTIDAIMNNIVKALKASDKVTIVDFGTFSIAKHAARNGRNPQTGALVKIKAKNVPKFKAGKDFAAKIAKSKK